MTLPSGPLQPGGRRGVAHAAARAAVAVLAATVVVATLVTACAGTGGPAGAQRSTSPPSTGGEAVVVARAGTAAAVPAFDGRLTFLVIGSDAGAPRFGRGGSAERGLADSIHLVVVDGKRRRGMVIGIPRDSYVPIPGHGTRKINAALNLGGPRLLVRTVEQLARLRIDYYALTSFDGLVDIVNGVGGVTVDVDRRVVDRPAGANLRKGRQRLSGHAALAYSRARKSLPDGDFGRSEHQGDVLIGGLRTFRAQSDKDPAAVIRWLAVALREVKTDLPFGELFRLALFATRIEPGNLRNVVLPGRPATAGGASIVRLDARAYELLANARAGRY